MWFDYGQCLSNETQWLVTLLKCWNNTKWSGGKISTVQRIFSKKCHLVWQRNPTQMKHLCLRHMLSCASSIVDKFSMTNTIATITDRSRCSSTKIGKLSSVCTEKRGKQSSTIRKPLSHKICHINLRTQNVSWNMEISHNHSNHPDFILRRMLYSASHASKPVEPNLILTKNAEKAFISVGYKKWSNAARRRGFDKHNWSGAHRDLINAFASLHNNVRTLESKFLNHTLKRNAIIKKFF